MNAELKLGRLVLEFLPEGEAVAKAAARALFKDASAGSLPGLAGMTSHYQVLPPTLRDFPVQQLRLVRELGRP